MKKREPLMDQDYFDRSVAYQTATIARFEAKLPTLTSAPHHRATFAYSIFRKRYEILLARYSRGEDPSEISDALPAAIEAWDRYLRMEGHEPYELDQAFDHYVPALWLVSFAIIFEAGEETLTKLVGCIGEPRDSLMERLLATRVSGRTDPGLLLWPVPYQPLNDAIDAPAGQRPELLREFLSTWYPASRRHRAYWVDNYKGPQGGGFFGYWCIEAAAVVTAFGIDDSSFREMRHYPAELVRRSSSP